MNLILQWQSDDGYWYIVDDKTYDKIDALMEGGTYEKYNEICEILETVSEESKFFTQHGVTENVDLKNVKRIKTMFMM